MNIDAITLAAVADEWRLLLMGARIDTIIQPTEHSIAIQCYAPGRDQQGEKEGRGGQNRWLYLSAHPQMARAHITALKPPKIVSEPPPFVMLLRKYLEGTRIEAVEQPHWDRVLHLVAGYRNPESEERVRFRLIIEIMGRLSNIIFCDDSGTILGSLKRVGADVNRYRVIASGVPYMPPPPQQRVIADATVPRLEPSQVTAAQLAVAAAEESAQAESEQGTPAKEKRKRKSEQSKLWQLLTRNLLGCSPLLAREAVYRTTEDSETALKGVDDNLWEELAWNMRELAALYENHQWHPQLVEREASYSQQALSPGQKSIPVVAAPYVMEQYADQPGLVVRESPSINVLLDEYFARAEWSDALEHIRGPIRKVLQAQRERCERKAQLLQQELAVSEEAAQYRLYGDLLLAHQHEVVQGASSVSLLNYFGGDEAGTEQMVTVPLDPRYDAVGNANRLFHKYHKLRRALELVPAQIEQNDVELATVRQLLADLALAETPAEVALVKAEVQSVGYLRGKRVLEDRKAQKGGKKGKGGKQGKGKPVAPGGGVPISLQDRNGFHILIGKNSRQNEEVTFHQATGNDVWLHARGVPGAHVIIKSAGRTVPQETIERAASLAAYYSEARGSTNVSVDYTQQRHVRHMKGGGPGMVIYDHERTIYAHPDEALAQLNR